MCFSPFRRFEVVSGSNSKVPVVPNTPSLGYLTGTRYGVAEGQAATGIWTPLEPWVTFLLRDQLKMENP
jgi:hypothetical protein